MFGPGVRTSASATPAKVRNVVRDSMEASEGPLLVTRRAKNMKGSEIIGALQAFWPIAGRPSLMGAVAFGVGGPAAVHHLMDVRAGEADIAEQTIVELEQIGVGAALFRTAGKRTEGIHVCLPYLRGVGRGCDRCGGLCPGFDEPVMNVVCTRS